MFVLRVLAVVAVVAGVGYAFVGLTQGNVVYLVAGALFVVGPGYWLSRSGPKGWK